jgi:flagellar M-ring protein FliF
VTDGKGNVLGGSGRKTGSAFAGSQWDNRQKVERDLAQNAETMLARVLGPNNAEVRVNAEMEFHNRTERSETYDADNQVLKSEHIEEEETNGGGSRVGGPVGSDQQGDEQPSSGQGTAQSSSTEEIETEYLVGKTVTESKKMGADINQLSVAAVVDRGNNKEGKDGAEGKKPSLEEIKQIIRKAVSYDEARGDSLTVTEADMSGPALKPPKDSNGMLPDWSFRLARYGAVIVVAGVCLLIAVKALRNGSEQQMPDLEVELLPESEEDDGRSREEIAWEQVTDFVEERPEETGRLLEAWIQSERQT